MCLRISSTGMSFELDHSGFKNKFSLECSLDGESQVCNGEKVNKYGHTLKRKIFGTISNVAMSV